MRKRRRADSPIWDARGAVCYRIGGETWMEEFHLSTRAQSRAEAEAKIARGLRADIGRAVWVVFQQGPLIRGRGRGLVPTRAA